MLHEMRTGTRLLTLDSVPLLESLGRLIRAEQVPINSLFLADVQSDSRAHLAGTALIPPFRSSKSLVKELLSVAT